jgi:hypothetical protein
MSDQEDSSEMDPTECLAFIELESENGEYNLGMFSSLIHGIFLMSFVIDILLYPGREIVIGRDDKWYVSCLVHTCYTK